MELLNQASPLWIILFIHILTGPLLFGCSKHKCCVFICKIICQIFVPLWWYVWHFILWMRFHVDPEHLKRKWITCQKKWSINVYLSYIKLSVWSIHFYCPDTDSYSTHLYTLLYCYVILRTCIFTNCWDRSIDLVCSGFARVLLGFCFRCVLCLM